MSAAQFAFLYLLTLATAGLLDGLWLLVIMKNFYKKQIGHLMLSQANWFAVVAYYLIIAAGIIVLAVLPAVEKQSFWQAVFSGALLGLCGYGTYNLTNLATLKTWPLTMVLVDMTWGVFFGGCVAAISFYFSGLLV